jgi:hypothetical protein
MTERTKIHEKFLEYPELVEARERAENAIIAFDKLGATRCTNRSYGPWHLCVNVKVREYPLNCAPEIRESMSERWYDYQQDDFWNLDFDGDCIVREECPLPFPKFFSDGRSGGYFVFDGNDSKRAAPALNAYNQQASNYGGSGQTPRPEGNIDIALSQFDDVVDPFKWITEVRDFEGDEEKEKAWVQEDVDGVTAAYAEMAEVFEAATEWAQSVLDIKKYRLSVFTGKEYEALNSLADQEQYDFFDFEHCTIVTDGDETTVSWPQHARQFQDCGKWETCEKDDEGAREWHDGTFKKFIPDEPKVFSFTMPRDSLIEQLNEELHDAVAAIRKRALKS